jgi:hypothetical protein
MNADNRRCQFCWSSEALQPSGPWGKGLLIRLRYQGARITDRSGLGLPPGRFSTAIAGHNAPRQQMSGHRASSTTPVSWLRYLVSSNRSAFKAAAVEGPFQRAGKYSSSCASSCLVGRGRSAAFVDPPPVQPGSMVNDPARDVVDVLAVGCEQGNQKRRSAMVQVRRPDHIVPVPHCEDGGNELEQCRFVVGYFLRE